MGKKGHIIFIILSFILGGFFMWLCYTAKKGIYIINYNNTYNGKDRAECETEGATNSPHANLKKLEELD